MNGAAIKSLLAPAFAAWCARNGHQAVPALERTSRPGDAALTVRKGGRVSVELVTGLGVRAYPLALASVERAAAFLGAAS